MLAGLSQGAQRGLLLAAEQPERVAGAVFICPAVALGDGPPWRGTYSWEHEQIEDCVGWGLETTPEVLIATNGRDPLDAEAQSALAGRVRCPVLVIQGGDDAITGRGRGIGLAESTGGELVMLEGSGHGPHARDPVVVNLLLRDFLRRLA